MDLPVEVVNIIVSYLPRHVSRWINREYANEYYDYVMTTPNAFYHAVATMMEYSPLIDVINHRRSIPIERIGNGIMWINNRLLMTSCEYEAVIFDPTFTRIRFVGECRYGRCGSCRSCKLYESGKKYVYTVYHWKINAKDWADEYDGHIIMNYDGVRYIATDETVDHTNERPSKDVISRMMNYMSPSINGNKTPLSAYLAELFKDHTKTNHYCADMNMDFIRFMEYFCPENLLMYIKSHLAEIMRTSRCSGLF